MVTVGLVFILVLVIWSFITSSLDLDTNDDAASFVGFLLALFLAFAVLFGIGTKNSNYTANTVTQPIVSIYSNQDGDQIYLKTLQGSKLVYWQIEDGVPREQTVSTANVKEVVIKDVNPYVEITKFSFAKKWYKLFMFDSKSDVYVFYITESGIDSDIGSFLK